MFRRVWWPQDVRSHRTCPRHVPDMSRTCPDVSRGRKACAATGHVPDMSQTRPGHVPTCLVAARRVQPQDMSQTCPGHVPDMSRRVLWPQDVCSHRTCPASLCFDIRTSSSASSPSDCFCIWRTFLSFLPGTEDSSSSSSDPIKCRCWVSTHAGH